MFKVGQCKTSAVRVTPVLAYLVRDQTINNKILTTTNTRYASVVVILTQAAHTRLRRELVDEIKSEVQPLEIKKKSKLY